MNRLNRPRFMYFIRFFIVIIFIFFIRRIGFIGLVFLLSLIIFIIIAFVRFAFRCKKNNVLNKEVTFNVCVRSHSDVDALEMADAAFPSLITPSFSRTDSRSCKLANRSCSFFFCTCSISFMNSSIFCPEMASIRCCSDVGFSTSGSVTFCASSRILSTLDVSDSVNRIDLLRFVFDGTGSSSS